MPRARIGKLFHLTPLVDDLAPAEYFFNSVFAPLCMMRNYSSHWHRHAAIYIIGETSIPDGAGRSPGTRSPTRSRIARMCSGVVPQQPPTMPTP